MSLYVKKSCLLMLASSLLGLNWQAFAEDPYVSQKSPQEMECHALYTMTASKLVELSQTNNPFWREAGARKVYLVALHGNKAGKPNLRQFGKLDLAEKSSLAYAAIVKHNIVLLRYIYTMDIDPYFIKNLQENLLGAAAKCNFYRGVKFLLKEGLNPNEIYIGAGPFIHGLSYDGSRIPMLLLTHGYIVGKHRQWCLASKYMLNRNPNAINVAVADKIRNSSCQP